MSQSVQNQQLAILPGPPWRRNLTQSRKDTKARGMVAVCKDWPSAKTFASLCLCALALSLAGLKSTAAGATPRMATGTGALPGKVPIGGRAQAPANGSLGWTNGERSREKVCVDARPHLLSSPPGRGNDRWTIPVLRMMVRPIPSRVFQKDGARFSLSANGSWGRGPG
jgi:hypothetical protein